MATFKIIQKPKNVTDTTPVYIRITHKRKKALVSTGVSIAPVDFNPERGEVRKSNPYWRDYNKRLSLCLHRCQTIEYELSDGGRTVSAKAIKAEFNNDGQELPTIIEALEDYKSSVKYVTQKKINDVQNKIEASGMNADVNEITPRWVERFFDYIVQDVGNKPVTAKKHLDKVKATLNRLERREVISHAENPFNKQIRLETGGKRSRDVKLEPDEIKTLLSYSTNNPKLQIARDVFMFQFLTWGMRIGDALSFSTDNIRGNRLVYIMTKSDDAMDIEISPPLREIIDRYYRAENEFLFPFYEGEDRSTDKLSENLKIRITQRINKRLKYLAKDVNFRPELQKRLTTHVARHSFTYLAVESVPLPYLQQMLGHENVQLTIDYAGRLKGAKFDDYSANFYRELL